MSSTYAVQSPEHLRGDSPNGVERAGSIRPTVCAGHVPLQQSKRPSPSGDTWYVGATGEMAHLPVIVTSANLFRVAAIAALCGDDFRSECGVYMTASLADADVPRCGLCLTAWEVRQRDRLE